MTSNGEDSSWYHKLLIHNQVYLILFELWSYGDVGMIYDIYGMFTCVKPVESPVVPSPFWFQWIVWIVWGEGTIYRKHQPSGNIRNPGFHRKHRPFWTINSWPRFPHRTFEDPASNCLMRLQSCQGPNLFGYGSKPYAPGEHQNSW